MRATFISIVTIQSLKPGAKEWGTVDPLRDANAMRASGEIDDGQITTIAVNKCNYWRNHASDNKGAFLGYKFRVHKSEPQTTPTTGRKIKRVVERLAVKRELRLIPIDVEQDGRDFYCYYIDGRAMPEDVITINDRRHGDTSANAVAWRTAFTTRIRAQGYSPHFM